MGWIFKVILGVTLLSYTLFTHCLISTDPNCYDYCRCCKDRLCQTGMLGWTNVCTKGCIDGHRGARCYELCQYNNCKSCGHGTGSKVCDACYDGYYLGPNKDCTLECPYNCKSYNSSTLCTECKAGFYDQDGSTVCQFVLCPANCQCNLWGCIACKKGFYDIITSCNSPCPLSCDTCESSESCSECKTGFYNGYDLDNPNSLYLSNCTYACRETCTKCVSYDSCVQCIEGKYGQTCQTDCSTGCKHNTCTIDSGKCTCPFNITGGKCIECVVGYYGHSCKISCPKYCKNNNCHKTFGYCRDGCITKDLTGKTCDVCVNGMYGEMCTETCPDNCKNQTCDRNSGVCVDGCEDNFNGSYCDVCIHGNYGKECLLKCADRCTKGVCYKESGHCFSCIKNFDGAICDTCLPGFYGDDCNDRCSLQCLDGLCDIKSGICKNGCKRNYSGDKCCVGNDNCVKCSSNTNCTECKPGYFNFSCGQTCSQSCASSCNFDNGTCRSCVGNMFGLFCNFKCPENCKGLKDVAFSRCEQTDGTCRFGCKDRYFGPACNMTCSIHCIDGICMQETGICTKGCNGPNNADVCVLTAGQTKEPQKESHLITVQVLGSIFGLATAAIAILAVAIILKRRWPFRSRNLHNPELQVQFENKSVTLRINKELNMPSGERDSTYDAIRKETDPEMDETYEEVNHGKESEQEYPTVSVSVCKEQVDSDAVNNTDYANLIL